MFVWLIKKLTFIIIIQPFIIFLLFFIVPPGFYKNFDYFLKGRSPLVLSMEQQLMEAFVVRREFSTKVLFQNAGYEQHCIFGPEVYPLSGLQKDVKILHNVGGWGWNDMAFYLIFSKKEHLVLIELPRYIPIKQVEKICGENLLVRFSSAGMFEVEKSD